MLKQLQPFSVRLYFLLFSLFAIVTVFWRAYVMPFNHDEVATFFHYVQNGEIYPFFSEVDANNHFLNTFLTRAFFLLFGDHPFVLRLANVLSLPVLIFAVYRFCLMLRTSASKKILIIVFLASFYWLCFFAFCRGYGISMAFFVLALSYLVSYCQEIRFKHFLLFILTLHLALAANLILIIPSLVLISLVILYQLIKQELFVKRTILIHLLSVVLIGFWMIYSIYLKKNGALYYGAGDSYWQVTFLTLSELLTNLKTPLILFATINLIIGLTFFVLRSGEFHVKNISLLFLFLLVIHLLAFYLMKKLMDINYPEDRTGLFFFVFAALFIVFAVDQVTHVMALNIITYLIIVPVIVHTAINWNVNRNNVPNYELIPEKFYAALLDEQRGQTGNITIGGYRMKQLIYAFMNYRNGGDLNLMDPVESMHTYTDYYIGDQRDSVFYSAYYKEISRDDVYGYRLLKRWKKLDRIEFYRNDTSKVFEGDSEYNNFFDASDLEFKRRVPMLAELDLEVKEASVPFKAWVVLEVQDEKGERMYYKSWPFNWVKYDWNNYGHRTISITTGVLPSKAKRVICYIWNIRKLPMKIERKSFRIFYLDGIGAGDHLPEE